MLFCRGKWRDDCLSGRTMRKMLRVNERTGSRREPVLDLLLKSVLLEFRFNQSICSILSLVNNIDFVCLGIAEYIEAVS